MSFNEPGRPNPIHWTTGSFAWQSEAMDIVMEEAKKDKEDKESSRWNPIEEALFKKRIVYVSGVVQEKMAYAINKQLIALASADNKKPIYLFINSPGGEVSSGFSIYDTARFLGPEIYTVVVGLAASMGSLIALCAKKENRYAFPNSKILIHQPLISGELQGQASDLEIHARDIIKTKERINRLYSEETGRPYDEVVKATDRDRWFDAEEAKGFGLVSKIIRSESELFKS